MAVDYYMAPVAKNGELYTSESTLAGSIKDPFPGRPAFTDRNLFEITDFSFQVEQALNIAPQSTSGRATFNQMRVTRNIDRQSPHFFYMCAAGISFKYVDIFARRAGGSGTAVVFYLAYGLENVIIKSIDHSGSNAEAPGETLSLEYRVLRVGYSPQNSDGSMNPFQLASWDQVANTGTG